MPASTANDIIAFVVALLFSILLKPSWAKTGIRFALQNESFITGILRNAGVVFAPGLLELLKSVNPPSISWFESLDSAIPSKRWAVYCVVLRKQG